MAKQPTSSAGQAGPDPIYEPDEEPWNSKDDVQLGMTDPGKKDYSQQINDPFEMDRSTDTPFDVKQDKGQ
jgi:hypothetical protein